MASKKESPAPEKVYIIEWYNEEHNAWMPTPGYTDRERVEERMESYVKPLSNVEHRVTPYVPESVRSSRETALAQALLTNESLEIGRRAIEDQLVEFRDSRISVMLRGNGLVIKEFDGTDSSMIRMGPEDALRIGIKAILADITTNNAGGTSN